MAPAVAISFGYDTIPVGLVMATIAVTIIGWGDSYDCHSDICRHESWYCGTYHRFHKHGDFDNNYCKYSRGDHKMCIGVSMMSYCVGEDEEN